MPSAAELRAAFAAFDSDGNGVLTYDEISGIFTRPGGGKPMTEEEAMAWVEKYDKSGDGTLDGWAGSSDGGTFFSTWDGRDEEGVSAEGMFPPGEDLIEDELKQLFNVGSSDITFYLDVFASTDLSFFPQAQNMIP